jgi:DNA-binding MarR family transcriptional regulator
VHATAVNEETPAALSVALLEALNSIRRSARRRARRPVELADLTGAQLELVRLVRRRPRISVADAAQELRLAPNTVSTLVRHLGEAGFVERAVDESDRRVARLDLRPDIRRKVDAWRDRRVVAVGEAIGALSPRERERLAKALPALAQVAELLEGDA